MPRSPFRIVAQVPGFARVLRHKPLLVASVLRERWMARLGQVTLKAWELALTYRCQASCAHCSATALMDVGRERDRLAHDEIRELASQARALGAYEVSLTGGEPTLRNDLEAIVGLLDPARTFIGLNTNGAMLDEARMQALADAGVDLFKLSLDSADPAAHDANRGLPGNAAQVIGALAWLRRHRHARGHICAVGTREAIRSGDAAALVRLAEAVDATIGFTLPAPVGRWTGHAEHTLGADDLAALREICRHPRAFLQGSVGRGEFECPAGRSELYVSPYGDVLPCPYLQQTFGDLRRSGLPAVWARMTEVAARAGDVALCRAASARVPGRQGAA